MTHAETAYPPPRDLARYRRRRRRRQLWRRLTRQIVSVVTAVGDGYRGLRAGAEEQNGQGTERRP